MVRVSVNTFRNSRVCRITAYAVLMLFALRAAVPVGYMPDLGALRDGQVQIVICTGTGTQALLVDQSGHPVEDGGAADQAGASDCAFAISTASALALPSAVPLLSLPVAAGRTARTSEAGISFPPAQGPPLGPRAPPILLG
jgi:Protein of unknown function (DUF2946)